MYVKLTHIEGLDTLIVWLSRAEQQDHSIFQLIEKCAQKMNIIIFLSGNQYTLTETIDILIGNYRKQQQMPVHNIAARR